MSRSPRHESGKQSVRRPLLITVIVGLVLTGLAFGGQWLLRQSYFRVQHVLVTGNAHESSSEVEAKLGLDAHPILLTLSTAQLTKEMHSFPWVAAATVTKHWPNTIAIAVSETTPVAVTWWHGAWVSVGANGFDLGMTSATTNLPTLQWSGSMTSWPFTGPAASDVLVASELPSAFAAQVSTIRESAAGSISLSLTTPVRFILGAPTQLPAKFVAIASVIKNATLTPGDVVDVTVPTELAVSHP